MEKFIKFKITPQIDTTNIYQAKFTIGPLEHGFGTTLGNALRRTLLMSIPGSSIFAIKIPHVSHEFQAMKGIKEDVTQIILNLKNLVINIPESSYPDEELFNLKLEQWPLMKISQTGKKVVLASDIELPPNFEIINKDLYIATITDESAKLDIEIYATRGRGFKSFTQNKELISASSIIATDSSFSPIVRVGYSIEEQKLSKTTIGDILVMDVATNGAIKPETAIAIASKILVEHLQSIVNIDETINQIKIMQEMQKQQEIARLSIPIEDLNLSVRSFNCLKRRGIQTIQELTNMSKTEIEKIKNLGKKSVNEIKKKLQEYKLSFKE